MCWCLQKYLEDVEFMCCKVASLARNLIEYEVNTIWVGFVWKVVFSLYFTFYVELLCGQMHWFCVLGLCAVECEPQYIFNCYVIFTNLNFLFILKAVAVDIYHNSVPCLWCQLSHIAILVQWCFSGVPGNWGWARGALLAIMLFYTPLSAGAVVCTSAWRSSSVYRD